MASRIAAPSSSAGILSLHLGLGRPVMGYSLIRKGKLSASSMTSMLARVPAPVVSSLFTRRHLHSGHIPRPHPVQVLPEAIVNHHSMRLTIRRSFHATSRRRAIPLIPAAIGIFKGTTVLAAATTISRILISLFPLGTIVFLRIFRSRRFATEHKQPEVSQKAEEFWKMWCEEEKSSRLTDGQAAKVRQGLLQPDGGVVDSDGRTAYLVALPKDSSRFRSWHPHKLVEDPTQSFEGRDKPFGNVERRMKHLIQETRFYLPELPVASRRSYEELSPVERDEVIDLRRYWVGLRLLKAHLGFWLGLVSFILILPFVLISGVYLFALERTPLTGRWRIILLTPEEEDKISTSLSGANWYRSVVNLLTTPENPAPKIVPYEDQRWRWVEGVLRQLETAVRKEADSDPSRATNELQGVPPAKYPLRPRPRMSSMLHTWLLGGGDTSGQEHLEIGPPYSLMLMEKTDRNAFSYGFGGKGASGIVVYTGLLDDILRSLPNEEESMAARVTPKGSSFLRGLLSNLFPSSPVLQTDYIQPTDEQTLHLACVLAHEMGHLLLSHHLETLSQQQVLWPSFLGISLDLMRAFVWPITWILGPAVNDALANVGRTTSEEMADRYGQLGFQWKHEYEADLAGIRLLALAGFDPHLALEHFSAVVADLEEIQPMNGKEDDTLTGKFFKLWTRTTHPSPQQRTEAIRKELQRWQASVEAEKR